MLYNFSCDLNNNMQNAIPLVFLQIFLFLDSSLRMCYGNHNNSLAYDYLPYLQVIINKYHKNLYKNEPNKKEKTNQQFL